jgi:hypothetical protein
MRGRGETARGTVHFLAGACALTLKWLSVPAAALIAVLAVVFNFLVLPRIGGRGLFRQGERQRPLDSGIHLYPIAVLILILVFGRRMEVVVAAWLIMAAGDRRRAWWDWRSAAASCRGTGKTAGSSHARRGRTRQLGRAPLDGAPRKPLFWPSQACSRPSSNRSLAAERQPHGAAAVGALPVRTGGGPVTRLSEVLPELRSPFLRRSSTCSLAVAFRNAGLVDRSGMVAGFAVGLLTWTFAGWRAFAVLLAFFVLGSGTTRLGRRRKERLGVAQERRGARSARHALANCGVAAYLAVLAATDPVPGLWLLALVCAYATAAFDTVSSEIGQAGGRPVLITTFRVVPVGTDESPW